MNLAIVRRILFPCKNILGRPLKVELTIVKQPHRCLFKLPRNDFGNYLNAVDSNNEIIKRSYGKFSRGKSSIKQEGEEEDENEDAPEKVDPMLLQDVDGNDVKIIKTRLNSLRLDTLLKAGLGISKSKVEAAFYESKIRVNGEKILKKSKQMNIGDEIDIIKGYNGLNPAFLDISRVIIISVENTDTEKITVVLKRFKQLVIDNYPDPFTRAV